MFLRSMFSICVLFAVVSIRFPASYGSSTDGVFSLTTIAPDGPVSELLPLDAMASRARLIGVGEISHGTLNDTSRFKVVKYLVEQHGYRVIFAEHAIATTLQDRYRAYLERGEGTLESFMAMQSAWVFQTYEYAEFFRWLSEFNRANPNDQVQFLGVDVLNESFLMVRELEKAAAHVDDASGFSRELERVKDLCLGARATTRREYYADSEFVEWERTSRLDPARVAGCTEAAENLQTIVDRSESLLSAGMGAFGSAVARNMPRSIRAFEIDKANFRIDLTGSQTVRGEVMFDNLNLFWNAIGTEKKAVYFAHNYHVAKKQRELAYRDWPNVYNTGERLAALYGDAYQAIGFTAFAISSFYATTVRRSVEGSLEWALNERAEDLFLIDTRGGFSRSRDWTGLLRPQALKFEDQFDFLLYQREVTPARAIYP